MSAKLSLVPAGPFEPLHSVESLDELDIAQVADRLHAATEQLAAQRTVLAQEAAPQIRHTEDRLRDVTSATETAATSIMDGVTQLMEVLDRLAALALPPEAAPLVSQLSDGLFDLTMHLQFQDITSQQLRYAESVLRATEIRLLVLAAEGTDESAPERENAAPVAFDPRASSRRSPNRQASIDSLFSTG
jgi:chemotaxis regulatin CheY-phosphate phosphatase CheZ